MSVTTSLETTSVTTQLGADGVSTTVDGSTVEVTVGGGEIVVTALMGANGADGADGAAGADGVDGKSAYELAVDAGFVGTEQEWLDSIGATWGLIDGTLADQTDLQAALNGKVSTTNTGNVSVTSGTLTLGDSGVANRIYLDGTKTSIAGRVAITAPSATSEVGLTVTASLYGNVAEFKKSDGVTVAAIANGGLLDLMSGDILMRKNHPSLNWLYGDLKIGTLTNEFVRVAGTGNVGIGTTTPTQKLHVAGNIVLGPTGGGYMTGGRTGNIMIGEDLSGSYILAGSNVPNVPANLFIGRMNTDTIFQTNGGLERVRIASGGNVGIGTSTPTEKLHVVGNAAVSGGALIGTSPELVTNGTFDSDTVWVKQPGWSIVGGKATHVYASGFNHITQPVALVGGRTYEVTLTVSDYVDGTLRIWIGSGAAGSNWFDASANGTYVRKLTFITGDTQQIQIRSNGTTGLFNGSVDNVSIKESASAAQLTVIGAINSTGTITGPAGTSFEVNAANSVTTARRLVATEYGKFSATDIRPAFSPSRQRIDALGNEGLALATGTVDRVYIRPANAGSLAGYVGLNTLTPASPLHVVGNASDGKMALFERNANEATLSLFSGYVSSAGLVSSHAVVFYSNVTGTPTSTADMRLNNGALTVSGTINGLTLKSQGSSGIGIGANALGSTTGQRNVAIGLSAGQLLTTGQFNNFYGTFAGYDTSSGSNNTFVGHDTGRGITTGSWNTIVGANVQGLAASLSQNIILADGLGNIRAQADSTGAWTLSGGVTNAQVMIGGNATTTQSTLTFRTTNAINPYITANGGGLFIDAGFHTFRVGGTNRMTLVGSGLSVEGNITAKPTTSATPATNGDMTFELTNNTTLKVKVRGSDGVVREVTLNLT